MPELTRLESKLAEVLGLAMASRTAAESVQRRLEGNSGLSATLEKMHEEAAETEARCIQVAASFDGKKTAIADEARTVRQRAAQMLDVYLDDHADDLDGFEFLTMTEAAELCHWSVLQVMNDQAGDKTIAELVQWALPIQQRHYTDASESAKQLAAQAHPASPE
jgi:hypothetical protein